MALLSSLGISQEIVGFRGMERVFSSVLERNRNQYRFQKGHFNVPGLIKRAEMVMWE